MREYLAPELEVIENFKTNTMTSLDLTLNEEGSDTDIEVE